MALKNYTSNTSNTFDKIQKILAIHGASKIMMDYATDSSGKLTAIAFALDVNGQQMAYRLPAMVENVEQVMYGKKDRWGYTKKITEAQKEQAYRTAWANVRDWIDAQMAMIDTRQADVAQIFMPYLVQKNGKTLYENVIDNPQLLLN